jgi:hypothetical protein
MKRRISSWTILFLLLLALAACQANKPAPALNEQPSDNPAYPAGAESGEEAYPIPEIAISLGDEAYPINEQDLELLIRTWTLSTYAENDVIKDPAIKTLTFNADGTYELTTEKETTTGNWTAQLMAVEATLILDPGTEQVVIFEIVDLTEALLNLRSFQEGVQIDEQYLLAN